MEAQVPQRPLAGLPAQFLGVDGLIDDMGLALYGQTQGLDKRRAHGDGDADKKVVGRGSMWLRAVVAEKGRHCMVCWGLGAEKVNYAAAGSGGPEDLGEILKGHGRSDEEGCGVAMGKRVQE